MEREEARRRTLYLSVVGAVVFYLGYLAREAVVPLLVALLLAYVLAPLVAGLEKRGFSRLWAVTTLFLLFFGSVGTAVAFGVPPLLEQGRLLVKAAAGEPARTLSLPVPTKIRGLAERSPPATLEEFLEAREALAPGEAGGEEAAIQGNFERKMAEVRETRSEEAAKEFRLRHKDWLVGRFKDRVVAWDDRNRNGKFEAGYLFDTAISLGRYAREKAAGAAVVTGIEDLGIDAVPGLAESLLLHGGDVAQGALEAVAPVLRLLGWLLIVPLYTFFFLMRLEDVWTAFVGHLPGAYRDRVVKVLLEIHRMLIGFFRGRLLTMLVKGIYVGLLLGVVGAPFWPVFGAAAGLLTIVPAVGPLAAAVPAVVLAYAEGGSVTAGLAAVVLVSAEFVEGYILIPKMIGREVGLHPMAVISAILVGGALLGVFGIVIAIPLAAAAKIVWREFVLPAVRAKAAEPPRADGPHA